MAEILVIDDDPDFLNMISLLLTLNGFNVRVASSGEEGLSKLEVHDCDLVLVDLMMPGISGYEVCRRIRQSEEYAELPVVLLTAKSEKEDVVAGINAGANDYITKPFESDVLIVKIKSFVKIKELQDELKKKNKMLESLAVTDGLTGTYNHRYFFQRLIEEFERARRYSTSLVCVMIDLDFFKKINDKYGHLAGDQILIELCKKVLENIRKNDIFARYGGEEFVLILPHTNEEGGIKEADRIRKSVELHKFPIVGRAGDVTISMGVAAFPDSSAQTPEDLVKYADMALYEAKGNGRNKVEVFSAKKPLAGTQIYE